MSFYLGRANTKLNNVAISVLNEFLEEEYHIEYIKSDPLNEQSIHLTWEIFAFGSGDNILEEHYFIEIESDQEKVSYIGDLHYDALVGRIFFFFKGRPGLLKKDYKFLKQDLLLKEIDKVVSEKKEIHERFTPVSVSTLLDVNLPRI